MATKTEQQAFVDKYYPNALVVSQKYGINPLFALGQAALETGWGKSTPNGMLFGKKAPKNYTGKTTLERTREVFTLADKARYEKYFSTPPRQLISVKPLPSGKFEFIVKDLFVAYDTQQDAFNDWAALIARRYPLALTAKTPKEFGEGLVKGGYATDPNYAKTIESVVNMVIKIKK